MVGGNCRFLTDLPTRSMRWTLTQTDRISDRLQGEWFVKHLSYKLMMNVLLFAD